MAEDLHYLVRQLKAELEWAMRVGIEPADGARRPPVVVRDVEPYEPGADGGPDVEAASESALEPTPQRTDLEAPASAAPEAPAASERTPSPLVQLRGAPTLAAVREVLGDCERCGLHAGRRQIVFGVGNENADVMFIGEGPGAEEDRRGEPFVGKAGQLLTRIIEQGMGMPRSDVYIANIVKCRPPGNRDPEPDEVEACEPFLAAQIRVVSPRVIISLGKYASQTLLKSKTPITRLRGQWSEYQGTPVMPTYHPAYLLRNPAEKRPVWEDIQEVLKWLGRTPGTPSRS